MYILGDIGNTETKLCIVSKNNKISKKITFLSKSVNNRQLNILFKKNKIQLNKIEKILFCSVVPKTFSIINKFLSKKVRLKCYEVKKLNLKSLIKINSHHSYSRGLWCAIILFVAIQFDKIESEFSLFQYLSMND